ncbi:carbohydrate porin [Methylovirgula ligni]|uniref:OprB family porin n=2 Tax=Methylovirgula ligni TaxID=569860 RepID=A0A3D9YUK1_9HYPH|nr:carbohydrate porin [Methylovirgula ligni]REF86287.1 OprB family porin [Methylovirgula ligni]
MVYHQTYYNKMTWGVVMERLACRLKLTCSHALFGVTSATDPASRQASACEAGVKLAGKLSTLSAAAIAAAVSFYGAAEAADLPSDKDASSPAWAGAVQPTPQPYWIDLRTKPVADFGRTLASQGIYLSGFEDGMYNNVPAGGIMHGSFFTNWAVLGVNLDMARIAGINGAQMHIAADNVAGDGHSWKYNGADWAYLENWGNHDGFQLREFSWDQSLFNNHMYILMGRTVPKSGEFDGSELYCLFDTFMCSTPTMYGATGAPPSFVTSSWGFRMLIKPTKDTYAKAGVWEDEPLLHTVGHGGFPGEDWDFNKGVGLFVPAEMGYKTTFADDKYPRHYDVGFTYDSSRYTDPLYGSSESHKGRSEVFFQAQQMVWRPDLDDTRGLTVFGALNVRTTGEAPMRDSLVAGLFDRGPFESRPKDFVGLVVQNFWFNNRYTQAVDNLIGPSGSVSPTETMLELNYGAKIGPGITLIPYFEYIWNPDLMGDSTPVAGINSAVQVGLRLTAELNDALDLPVLERVRN